MTRTLLALTLTTALATATPLAAQDQGEGIDPSLQEGFSLLGEGARLILRGLQSEMAPMIEALGKAIDDVNAYELPEVQPNGDILIRRKEPLAPEDAVDPETGATDL